MIVLYDALKYVSKFLGRYFPGNLSEDLFQDVAFEKVSVYPCLSFQKKKRRTRLINFASVPTKESNF